MTADEVKQAISERTGIPADLLTGETAEENIVRAKALLAFRRNNAQGTPKSTKEQFAAWFREASGQDPQEDGSMQALKAYEEELRIAGGGYPRLTDGGEVNLGDLRSAKQAFIDHFNQSKAFDPMKDKDGWKTMPF